MKLAKHFVCLFVLITAFSAHGFSQTVDSKIASINTETFEDKQNGIKEITGIYEKLETEFKPQKDELNLIKEKIEKIIEEFKECEILGYKSPDPGCRPASIKDRDEKFRKLTAEAREKTEQKRLLYSKRKAEILAEINPKISDALLRFAKENGLVFIIDSSKNYGLVIQDADFADVTQKFIEFYNENYKQAEP